MPYQEPRELVGIRADSHSRPSACFHYFGGSGREVGLPNELCLIPSASSFSLTSWPDLWHVRDFDFGPW